MYMKWLEGARNQVKEGGPDCLIKAALKDRERFGLNDVQMSYVGGIFVSFGPSYWHSSTHFLGYTANKADYFKMEAGSDTTASALLAFCLVMNAYPHVLRKCQEEVDSLCADRMPSVEDTHQLPYLKACENEVPFYPGQIRCITYLLPLDLTLVANKSSRVSQAAIKDDVYGKYLIPKDTTVFFNNWSIHQDPTEYANPLEFVPERFLKNKFGSIKDDSSEENASHRVTYVFGAGRRVCAGQRLGENSLVGDPSP
jgi:hypothetical protein